MDVKMAQTRIFHETAPYSLFCDDDVVARPFWRYEDTEEFAANFAEHVLRVFVKRDDGYYQIAYWPAMTIDPGA